MSKVIKRSQAQPALGRDGWVTLPTGPAGQRVQSGRPVAVGGGPAPDAAREDIFRQAREDGFRRGYEEGKARAAEVMGQVEAAMRRAEEALRAVEVEREGVAALIDAERVRMLDELREDVARLAMAVAQQVLQRELSQGPEEVVSLVKRLLQEARDQDEITVLVHPAEAAALEAERGELLSGLRATQRVEIVPDPGIETGGAMLETPGGTWDARLSVRVEAVEQELREALGLADGEDEQS